MKKIISYVVDTFKEEYKFIITLFLLFIIFVFPINYYIIIGGGTSDVSSRIKVENKFKSVGSFNISYVEELKGTVATYLLSYIIPSWEREDANLYKYNENESIEDIEFRSDLDLLYSNSNATYWAYTLANKNINKVESKIYVIALFEEYVTPFKIGDQILSVNNNTYDSIDKYIEYLQTCKENDLVTVKVLRNNKEKILEAHLYKEKDRLLFGIGLKKIDVYETNPKVNIKFRASESGPSGGLITTLEIYNQLVQEDITKGKKIAGTGTIEEDGTIGEIGGVEYKILGAAKAHTDIFLVPAGDNYKDALKYKRKNNLKIKIVEIESIQDAIEKLNSLK